MLTEVLGCVGVVVLLLKEVLCWVCCCVAVDGGVVLWLREVCRVCCCVVVEGGVVLGMLLCCC